MMMMMEAKFMVYTLSTEKKRTNGKNHEADLSKFMTLGTKMGINMVESISTLKIWVLMCIVNVSDKISANAY